ncbi:MAG: GWxTD domain-containing protein [Gemmatimonadaceae bacterium]
MHSVLAHHPFSLKRFVAAVLTVVVMSGCGGRTTPPGGPPRGDQGAPGGPGAGPTVTGRNQPRGSLTPTFDVTPLYRQMGLIARGLPFPLLGRASFAATAIPDSTHIIVGVSFANTALSFTREADNRFRARYTVGMTLTRDGAVIARAETTEDVVVAAYREVSRNEESIVHQEILDAAPGRYTLTVAVRDEGSQRGAQEQIVIDVPRLGTQGFSSPMPVSEVVPRRGRDAVPFLLLNPSGTAIAGRDSVLPIYVEGYGDTTRALRLIIRNEKGRVISDELLALTRRGDLRSGVVEVPVQRIGIGVAQLTVAADGGTDSSSTYVFVGFGSDMPVATFEEMLNFLRHFASAPRLDRLRAAPEEARPAEWAAFMQQTDDQPSTREHEALRQYFGRLVRANSRFREEATPGWLSDRGRVFITLGEPDQLLEPQITDFQRNRTQVWEYQGQNLQLIFVDVTGTGRWRLSTSSEARFEQEYRRRLR